MTRTGSKETFLKIGFWIVFPLGLFCLITGGCAIWKKNPSPIDLSPSALEEMNNGAYTVSRVVDGETLELDSGEKVRLIGIRVSKEAIEFIRNLVEGHQIRLEEDVDQKDNDGRTLAYVWYLAERQVPSKIIDTKTSEPFMDESYEDTMLNEALIKAGYAQVMTAPPNVKHQELFVKAEKEAREGKQELWK